jgi:hypothetical protein
VPRKAWNAACGHEVTYGGAATDATSAVPVNGGVDWLTPKWKSTRATPLGSVAVALNGITSPSGTG